jgi:hypothetical protein
MIAEEYNIEFTPDLSIPKGSTVETLVDCLKRTAPFFQTARSQSNLVKPLNENKLTQILVEQVDIQLRKRLLAIGIKNQYSDLFYGTKGIPDFYFHALEEGITSQPLFVCEAKRLPAPTGSLNTEYVVGDKNNGGIERFKMEKHGKGFDEGGMIGFVESDTFDHWKKEVNSWITNLANTNTDWKIDEVLNMLEQASLFGYLDSLVYRKNANNLKLHHFWIN